MSEKDTPDTTGIFTNTRGGKVSVAVVGAVAVVALFVLGSIAWDALTAQDSDTPLVSGEGTVGKTASDSVCGLTAYETEYTPGVAPVESWELVNRVAVPSHPEIGPGITHDTGLRTCFAHTADGALYAAAAYIAVGPDPVMALDAAQKMLASGPGRDKAIPLFEESVDDAPHAPSIQTAGYKVDDYTGDTASIDLAVRRTDGQLVSIVTDLVWQEGDWKIKLTDSGQFRVAGLALTSLGGYTPWAGV